MPASKMSISGEQIAGLVLRLTLFGTLTYFGVKWMVDAIDPTKKQKVEAQKRAQRILKRIGAPEAKLTEYELAVAAQLVDPNDIQVSWSDIAGLDDVVQEIRESVILPIQRRELFAGSQLIQPPKGVLLHGPPGCGKTMIAKATAREAGARFINLEVSQLTDKWYGESQKLAAAVFTLAVKIQPCIIFIDEIDSFLRSRETHDHEATAMMKAQFMCLWDGLGTDNKCLVLVMGATNRPHDVDRAILRRMPAMFRIDLPGADHRASILRLVMSQEVVSPDVDIERLARLTEGFSGSDLRELCRNAALQRVRDYFRSSTYTNGNNLNTSSASDEEEFHDALRPISGEDFRAALQKMRASKVGIGQFGRTYTDIEPE